MRLAFVPPLAAAIAALSGCGNSTPAEPDTAWVVQMEQSTTNCGIADNTGNMGMLSDTSITSRATNGIGGASVQCSVVGSGSGPYSVTALAQQGQYTLNVTIPSITTQATQTAPAVGSITYESLATVDPYSSSNCNFYFTGDETVGPGKIWMTFSCAEITYGQASPPSTCSLSDASLAVFESCETVAATGM